ncbi:MAG: hypothetical protein KUG82_00660 [Pseudomonadales bacterium]|nr:hypothetical protein [Pseudomonadales bacterium]
MKFKSTVLVGAIALSSHFAFAGMAEERWESLPVEKQEHITARAAELGFDITTEEGRAAFRESRRETRRERRSERAAELGFDLSTEEGRQAFQDARQERREKREMIREGLADLSLEDREQLRSDMEGLSRHERRELMRERIANN